MLCVAQILVELGRFDAADEKYKRAQEIEPDNGNVRVHRGYVMLPLLNASVFYVAS